MTPPLPQVVQELIDIAGADAAWAIVRAWGGRNVYFPPNVQPDHWLVQLVGLDAADALCRHYRDSTVEGGHLGRRVLIPLASRAQEEEAWREALDPKTNLSLRDTAQMMGVHERTVSYRRAKTGRSFDKRQGKLPF